MAGYGYFGGPGPAQGADKTYTWVQSLPAEEWTCPHSLGKIPACTLRDDRGNEIGGDVWHASDGSRSVVRFVVPVSGTASFN